MRRGLERRRGGHTNHRMNKRMWMTWQRTGIVLLLFSLWLSVAAAQGPQIIVVRHHEQRESTSKYKTAPFGSGSKVVPRKIYDMVPGPEITETKTVNKQWYDIYVSVPYNYSGSELTLLWKNTGQDEQRKAIQPLPRMAIDAVTQSLAKLDMMLSKTFSKALTAEQQQTVADFEIAVEHMKQELGSWHSQQGVTGHGKATFEDTMTSLVKMISPTHSHSQTRSRTQIGAQGNSQGGAERPNAKTLREIQEAIQNFGRVTGASSRWLYRFHDTKAPSNTNIRLVSGSSVLDFKFVGEVYDKGDSSKSVGNN